MSASHSGTAARFDEQVAERGVGQVRVGRGQHDLRVASHVEAPRTQSVVGDRHAPQLDVVLGRDDDFGARFDLAVDAAKDGAVRGEDDLVVVSLAADRLKRRRPEVSALDDRGGSRSCPRRRW